MAPEDEVLLNNLLDSLNRLYDQDCGAVDVEFLVAATIIGVRERSWLPVLLEAKHALRSARGPSRQEAASNQAALAATGELRARLADWYSRDRVTMWNYDGFRLP